MKNEFPEVPISLQSPIPVDNFYKCKATGGFILIDTVSNKTVAGGMVHGSC